MVLKTPFTFVREPVQKKSQGKASKYQKRGGQKHKDHRVLHAQPERLVIHGGGKQDFHIVFQPYKALISLYKAVFAQTHDKSVQKGYQPEHQKKQDKRQYKQNGCRFFLNHLSTLSGCSAAIRGPKGPLSQLTGRPYSLADYGAWNRFVRLYCSDSSMAISVAFFSSSISCSLVRSGVCSTKDHTLALTYFTCSRML